MTTPPESADATTIAATTLDATATTLDATTIKDLFFFELERPGATIMIGAISIVHSLFHVPHCLMYRRLGILTAFWSLVGAGLVVGVILEKELLYDVWIWYSCVYVPVMLVTMCALLTAYIWDVDLNLIRVAIATFAVMFYLFMFYCIVFVNDEKRKIFTTASGGAETPCPTCAACATQPPAGTTTPAAPATPTPTPDAGDDPALRHVPKFIRVYRHLTND